MFLGTMNFDFGILNTFLYFFGMVVLGIIVGTLILFLQFFIASRVPFVRRIMRRVLKRILDDY